MTPACPRMVVREGGAEGASRSNVATVTKPSRTGALPTRNCVQSYGVCTTAPLSSRRSEGGIQSESGVARITFSFDSSSARTAAVNLSSSFQTSPSGHHLRSRGQRAGSLVTRCTLDPIRRVCDG